MLEPAAIVASAALPLPLALQVAKDGAPVNAFSTSVSVARPLDAWLILKIAPPNVPLCV